MTTRRLFNLGNLKLPFIGATTPRPEEDERLMHLFRNRAGLKKAHAHLQDQLYELREKLKQQEKTTQRVEAQLESLETLLGSPENGRPALVYFQLRGLWRACQRQLEQFCVELERRQEERERQRQVSEFNRDKQQRLAAIDQRLAAAEAHEQEQQRLFSELELQQARLKGFWNYFRRRRLAPHIERQRQPLAEARAATAGIREERNAVDAEAPPSFSGLSMEGKRSINLALIAYAMVLGARLSADGLATRARDAMGRRVNEVQFGSAADCERLMVAIARALQAIKSRKEFAGLIKSTVDRLREAARYRSEMDTVPLADTLGGIVTLEDGRALGLTAPQILADDYWYIYRVLLR